MLSRRVRHVPFQKSSLQELKNLFTAKPSVSKCPQWLYNVTFTHSMFLKILPFKHWRFCFANAQAIFARFSVSNFWRDLPLSFFCIFCTSSSCLKLALEKDHSASPKAQSVSRVRSHCRSLCEQMTNDKAHWASSSSPHVEHPWENISLSKRLKISESFIWGSENALKSMQYLLSLSDRVPRRNISTLIRLRSFWGLWPAVCASPQVIMHSWVSENCLMFKSSSLSSHSFTNHACRALSFPSDHRITEISWRRLSRMLSPISSRRFSKWTWNFSNSCRCSGLEDPTRVSCCKSATRDARSVIFPFAWLSKRCLTTTFPLTYLLLWENRPLSFEGSFTAFVNERKGWETGAAK